MSKHKIEISSASLTALKAEISRRQLEVKEKSRRLDDGCNVILSNNRIFSQMSCKSSKVYNANEYPKRAARPSKPPSKLHNQDPTSQFNQNLTSKEIETLEKSRKQLEAKSKLYAALKEAARTGSYSEDINEDNCPLVNFEKKIQEEAKHKIDLDSNCVDNNYSTKLNSVNNNFNKDRSPDTLSEINDSDDESHEPSSNYKDSSPTKDSVTYADLREGEIRDHGVGFYSFSKDAKKREQEMARLLELHRATELARKRTEEVRACRDAKLGARLAHLRARKGLPDAAEAATQCLQEQQQKVESVDILDNSRLSSAISASLLVDLVPTESSVDDALTSPLCSSSSDMPALANYDLDVASMLRRLRDEAEAAVTTTGNQLTMECQQQTSIDAITLEQVTPIMWRGRKLGTKMREWDRGKSITSAQRYIEEKRMERNSLFAPPSF